MHLGLRCLFFSLEFPFPPNGKVRVNSLLGLIALVFGLFPFPPNGKVRVNSVDRIKRLKAFYVSIPSKREGTCELYDIDIEPETAKYVFPFPPNGKVRVNLEH